MFVRMLAYPNRNSERSGRQEMMFLPNVLLFFGQGIFAILVAVRLLGWLVGWLVGWLIDWLVDRLLSWLFGWLIACLESTSQSVKSTFFISFVPVFTVSPHFISIVSWSTVNSQMVKSTFCIVKSTLKASIFLQWTHLRHSDFMVTWNPVVNPYVRKPHFC